LSAIDWLILLYAFTMRISRIQVKNFRNFHELDVNLGQHAVIVGENKIGKSNLIYGLRLVLDPSLPDSARALKDEDFWDGLPRPLSEEDRVSISIDFSDFENDERYLTVLGDFLISADPMVARLTFECGPASSDGTNEVTQSDYEFFIYGGDRPETPIGSEFRRRIPMDLLSALRDAEGDLASWRRSPLRPLLDEVAGRIDPEALEKIAMGITNATAAVTATPEIATLDDEIRRRLTEMVGIPNAIDTLLGFSPTEPSRILRSLRLLIDGGRRNISDASLGSANLLYLVLKTLQLEQLVWQKTRDHTVLAIEEPEAHLHPHLQRLVYRDFLKRRVHQESSTNSVSSERQATTILMTTHSPHIVSITPLDSLVLLRKSPEGGGSIGVSTALLEFDQEEREDLERYLDVTRGEMVFAKAVLLVEGDAETFILPVLGNLLGYDLDRLGITVCSVGGINFAPYVKLLGSNGLDIPFAVLTDFDPQPNDRNLGQARVLRLLGLIADENELADLDSEEQLALAEQRGIFLNEHTLEVDLFKCGRHVSMAKTLIELAESGPAKARANVWRKSPNTLDPQELLRDIETIGKGRFAQRLAGNLKNKCCPEYIDKAFKYVLERCV
jgi:putative ATP-dependent endonuclease of OLD family